MISNSMGFASFMTDELQKEVEKQLITDFKHYTKEYGHLRIDWSNSYPGGHFTNYLGGELVNWSGIRVLDSDSNIIAEGWIDFIHGGAKNPLHVFWRSLTVNNVSLKTSSGIPQHVWDVLSDKSKRACRTKGKYDCHWCDDPLVRKAKKSKKVTNNLAA